MSSRSPDHREWLEADGLGGFASGTVSGTRTRRYHALLLTATTPPTGRLVLVNGFDAWVETANGLFPISSQLYTPGVTHPGGADSIESFSHEPWPCWTFRLPDGTRIKQEIVVEHGTAVTSVTWRLMEPRDGVRLSLRPFLSGRDYHALHHENPAFRFDAEVGRGRVTWHPYEQLPGIVSLFNGQYEHSPDWYRNFQYDEERARGLDFVEDLATPGVLRWSLSDGEAVWLLAADGSESALRGRGTAIGYAKQLRRRENQRRNTFASPLHRAADAYVVRRQQGKTIVAGYPWFTDWGRDTFIALRGICLAAGRLDTAREILLEWAGTVSEGMLPNRFPDSGDAPEFNAVDASLWYIIAVHDYLAASKAAGQRIAPTDLRGLRAAVDKILSGYARGTRY
ncbi:MAG TPA: glycogen debranching enzyme N-terminal domain-containing protein, partial [Candidatus Acidoferrales bacterium]|nr:glycogen debranching enzyme N-terminal domain-containing protein [Candidatus Acidoferrales bacterium]